MHTPRTVSDRDGQPGRGALRADGTLERPPRLTVEEPAAPLAPPEEPPLELVERPPRGFRAPDAALAFETHRPGRRAVGLVITMALAGVALFVAAMLVTPRVDPSVPEITLPDAVNDALPELGGPPLVIETIPPGATVRGPAGVLGTTPWAGNNPFMLDTELTITLGGYRPRALVVPGTREGRFTLQLERVRR